jgi:glycolate oxidase
VQELSRPDNTRVTKLDVITELQSALPTDQVLTDESELFVYNADGFTIPRSSPAAVVFPQSTEDVVRIMKILSNHDIEIVPRGSGTGLAGGCTSFNHGIVISTARMNKVLKVDLENRVAHVEAGVRNVQLSETVALEEKRQGDKATRGQGDANFTLSPGHLVALSPSLPSYHFSPDPSSQRASTIGGNTSTNAGGIHCLKDFVTSNHVLAIEMVLPDGSVIRAGTPGGVYEQPPFDLPGLICGHEGTFGVVTRVWVRLVPKATHFRTIVSIFTSTSDACRTVSQVIADGMLPAAMEMLDGAMVQILEDSYHFGFPKNAQALVLTEIDGIDELLDAQMQKIIDISKSNNAFSVQGTSDAAARAKLWKARKSAFGAVGKVSPSYCTQDACVPRSSLENVLAKVADIGKQYNIPITNVFHAGDGNIHPIFLYDDRDEQQVARVLEACAKLLTYCIDIGGTLTGEHGVGIEKVGLMEYLFDVPTMEQFRRVKAAFDPNEKINAGKLLPSEKLTLKLLKPGRHAPQ